MRKMTYLFLFLLIAFTQQPRSFEDCVVGETSETASVILTAHTTHYVKK